MTGAGGLARSRSGRGGLDHSRRRRGALGIVRVLSSAGCPIHTFGGASPTIATTLTPHGLLLTSSKPKEAEEGEARQHRTW
jgi:hypothetical protein